MSEVRTIVVTDEELRALSVVTGLAATTDLVRDNELAQKTVLAIREMPLVDQATKLMYARPASEIARGFFKNELVLVEVPPNCHLDASTSDVQATLRSCVERLHMLAEDVPNDSKSAVARGVASDLDRVRTMLGQPLDGLTRREAARDFFYHGVTFAREITSPGPGAEAAAFDRLWKERR